MTVLSSPRSPASSSSDDSTSTEHDYDSHLSGPREGQFGHFRFADVPKLKAIFFAQFENTQGVVIRYQHPDGFVSDEKLKDFSRAVIPKPEMFNRLVKINYGNYKVMGHPIGLTHDNYTRQMLFFNLCFVVDRDTSSDCIYEPLVQKCAEYLIEMEQEHSFIYDPALSGLIPDIMKNIFDGLNGSGESVIQVPKTMTTMYLKLCPSYRGVEPPKISPYMVPIFIRKIDVSSSHTLIAKMDVLSQKIIPHINGVRCVIEIASEVKIDADLVARCIRNLYFYECVSIVPLFLYSNTYCATEKLHDFYNNEKLHEECVDFVRTKRDGVCGPKAKFSDVFRLYASLRCGQKMSDWCQKLQPSKYNVDERRMIQFGVHHKFVRKLSVYPVALETQITNQSSENPDIFSTCDGTIPLDDLAVQYGVNPERMQELLDKSGKFAFVRK